MTTKETPKAKTVYLHDYRVPEFFIDQLTLRVELQEPVTRVEATLQIRRNPDSLQTDAPLVLMGEKLTLCEVALDGQLLDKHSYQQTTKQLLIPDVPSDFILKTVVTIKPQENTELSGLYQSQGNYCTQCEAEGFRRITYFLDRPDVMSRFTTTIIADKNKYPHLLSNGNRVEQRDLDGGKHQVTWQDPSLKPCYLFALVAGKFELLADQFVTASGRQVDLHLYVESGFLKQTHHAMQSLKSAMRWDEINYGREYDLDIYMIVAVSDFNMGAMENKGLNIFNTKYVLAEQQTATDSDYVAIADVISHEYFHNWSGNRVTCRDWFQLTLKEGLTVFRDQQFTEDYTRLEQATSHSSVARIDQVISLRGQQFPEDASPLAHPIQPKSYMEINNFYTATVYYKGAEVIRMLATMLGKETFRQGMDLYFSRHDGQAVTVKEFIKAHADTAKRDLNQFSQWYDQVGTPVLQVTGDYDQAAKIFRLQVKQSGKQALHLPLRVALFSKNGKLLAADQVLEVTKAEQSFEFSAISEKPVPSLLRGFSAPVRLEYTYTEQELVTLLLHDTDGFARWEAAQLLYSRCLLGLVQALKKQQALELPATLIQTVKTLLTSSEQDLSLLARLLTLPSVNQLVQHMATYDVDSAHAVCCYVQQQLAEQLVADWLACYQANQTEQYTFDMINKGKRDLKNCALRYLTLADERYRQQAYQQLSVSDNMTDSMGALQALNQQASSERTQALADFYARFADQPLVVNKWLALQAGSTLLSALDEIKTCVRHPAYNRNNPNSVYAVWVTFGNNLLRFHQADGAGYRLLTDEIIDIDKTNPQLSARLVTPLTQWRHYDKARQQLMQAELMRLLKQPKLSTDLYEKVSKSYSAQG